MKQILLTGFFFIIKISFIWAQSTPSFEALKAERQQVQELKRAYVKNQNEVAKNKAEVAQLQKKIIVLNDSLKLSCATYACAIGKTNSFLDRKNFQAAFDYINLADSYSDKNPIEIANLRDRFFKLMNLEVKGIKLKNYACSDYNCVIEKIKKALKIKDYQTAFENLESAESFPQKRDEQIRYLRKKFFDEIDKQRIAALTSRREAFTSAYELGKTKNELKETQKQTQKALSDLRNASDQAVLLLINEIDRNILRLEYDSTYEKCRIALNLKSEKYEPQVKERILEIVYWYTETDTFAAAIKTLNLLNINPLSNRNNLLETIKQNCTAQYFTFLEERYYPKMISIEGGKFTMGSNESNYEKPVYEALVRNFKISETEITYFQYSIFAKATKHYIRPPRWEFTGDNPVVQVNWYDAAFYLNWLSQKFSLKPVYTLTQKDELNYNITIDSISQGFRLPYEFEWEFASKGGNSSKGYRYSGSDNIDEVGWYYSNSASRTHSVKQKKSNELGLFDMSGNVYEWCNDINVRLFPNNNKNSDSNVTFCSKRSGSFSNLKDVCSSSFRMSQNSIIRDDLVGFRAAQNK